MLKYVSRQSYTIPGKSTITINFVDPMNYYRVVNSGNVTIYGGTVTMPTRKLYDFKVPAYNAKMYAEENVRKQLYLYNDGTEEATVLVYAFRSQFEPTVLALCDAIFNDTENTVSVEIDGFTEPLPTGNNKIGKVDVESMPTEYASNVSNIVSSMNKLLASSQNGGVVNLYSIYKLLSDLSSPTVQSAENTATTDGIYYARSLASNIIFEIAFISNDGSDNLTLTLIDLSNVEKNITLKSGETINHLKCFAKEVKVSGNNVPFRIVLNERQM